MAMDKSKSLEALAFEIGFKRFNFSVLSLGGTALPNHNRV